MSWIQIRKGSMDQSRRYRPQHLLICASPKNGRRNLLFVCNFTPMARPDYRVGVPEESSCKLILDSDAAMYGGSGQEKPLIYKAVKGECDGQPYSIAYPLAALWSGSV